MSRSRGIIRAPTCGGAACGALTETAPCNQQCCPVDVRLMLHVASLGRLLFCDLFFFSVRRVRLEYGRKICSIEIRCQWVSAWLR